MARYLRWTSVVLFSLLSAFFIWFGWLYASVEEPLWFHNAAVPDHAKEAIRPLYFALMNLIGGAALGLGVLGLVVTLTVLPKARAWIGAALALAYAIPFVMAAITAEELSKTGAPTSWHIMGVLLAVTLVACFAHALSSRVK